MTSTQQKQLDELDTSAQFSSRGISNDSNNEDLSDIQVIPDEKVKKIYGNIKILIDRPNMHISIGPDYIPFIIGLFLLVSVTFLLIFCSFSYVDSFALKFASIVLTIWSNGFYLLTALSNPGIYDPSHDMQPKHKYCHYCSIPISQKVRHCMKCNTCIEGLDHHCPWMSKCVGKGNINYFYILIVSLPFTAVYFWVTLFSMLNKRLT